MLRLCLGYLSVICGLCFDYPLVVSWLYFGYPFVFYVVSCFYAENALFAYFFAVFRAFWVMCGLSFGYVQLSLGYVLVMWSYLVVMSAYLYKWLWEHNYFGLKSWFYAFSSLCVCFSLACCKLFSNFVALFGEKSGQHKEALGFLYLKIAKFHK